MMKRLHFYVKRTHLYLSLCLLPWFLMYGLSSIPFSHQDFFDGIYGGWSPKWTVRFDRTFDLEVTKDSDLRGVGRAVLDEAGLGGAYGAYWQGNNRINVYQHTFRSSCKLTYFIDEKRLLAEDSGFRWDHFFTSMHARGGFQQESFLNDLWAVIVDLFCIAMLIWVATGIYMWWKIRSVRAWGALALGAGVVSFVVFLILL